MNYLPYGLDYPHREKPKLNKLRNLFEDWQRHLACAGSDLGKDAADWMVFDGFYPHYYSQKKRILFIGREARQIAGENYLGHLYDAYRGIKDIGGQHLNASRFHARMLYIAYGILRDMPEWSDIPWANQIGNTFATSDGISFAFMNLSKLSNEAEEWQSDWRAIDIAVKLSTEGRNFIAEQIAILKPDVVITMNLEDYLDSLGICSEQLKPSSSAVSAYRLESAGHSSLLLDCFHFSAPGKNDFDSFYKPVCEAIQHHSV